MILGTHADGRLIAVPGASVLVRKDGATATVYSSRAKAAMANPLPNGVAAGAPGIDLQGNMTVWLDAGDGYDAVITVGDVSTTIPFPTITPDAEDIAAPIPPGTYVKGDVLFDVRTAPSYDPIASDNSAAIRERLADAASAGGSALLPPGTTGFSGDIEVLAKAGLVGLGGGSKNASASLLVARNAAARVKVGTPGVANRGPMIGGFDIDANGLGLNPLYLACTSRHFEAMHVYSSVAAPSGHIGILFDTAQNNSLDKVNSTDGGINWCFDNGAGGNASWKCDSSFAAVSAVVFRESTGTGPYPVPQHNVFHHGVYERIPEGGSTPLIDHGAGIDNQFYSPLFNGGFATVPLTLLKMWAQANRDSANLQVYGGRWSGPPGIGIVAISLESAGIDIHLYGLSQFKNVSTIWNLPVAGPQVSIEEDHQVGSPTWKTGAGAEGTIIRRRFRSVQEITRTAVTDTWLMGLLSGEAGIRWRMRGDALEIGSGTDFAPDVLFRRIAANVAGVGADDAFRLGATTTAARPAAATAGAGALIHDSDVGRPIWSIGASWKESAAKDEVDALSARRTRVVKTADQNFIDNNKANVADMVLPIGANETMDFHGDVIYDSTTANDLQLDFTGPVGSALKWSMTVLGTTATSATGSGNFNVAIARDQSVNGGGARAAGAARVLVYAAIRGVLRNGATAGSLQLRAAKVNITDAATPADDAVVYSDSFLVGTR